MGGRGGAATLQYEKWEGERMFSPPPAIMVYLNPTSSPIFKWINELCL